MQSISSMKLPDWPEQAALDGLRKLLGQPDATWTSPLQRDAVMTVLNTEKDVLAILTTSSGKSMLSLIPALLERHLVTVLILPLKSLITDYKRKLDKMHFPYLHYTGQHIPRGYCTPNLDYMLPYSAPPSFRLSQKTPTLPWGDIQEWTHTRR